MIAPRVPPGATIGVVTPASPPPRRSDVLRGIEWWESHGHPVRLAPNAVSGSELPSQRTVRWWPAKTQANWWLLVGSPKM